MADVVSIADIPTVEEMKTTVLGVPPKKWLKQQIAGFKKDEKHYAKTYQYHLANEAFWQRTAMEEALRYINLYESINEIVGDSKTNYPAKRGGSRKD